MFLRLVLRGVRLLSVSLSSCLAFAAVVPFLFIMFFLRFFCFVSVIDGLIGFEEALCYCITFYDDMTV